MWEVSDKGKIIKNIVWGAIVIVFFVGLILVGESKSRIEYPVGEYWVAKEYHHVYKTYSGEIVDYIEEDERCKIDGDTIIVTTTNEDLYTAGVVICVIFGFPLTAAIWIIVEEVYYASKNN